MMLERPDLQRAADNVLWAVARTEHRGVVTRDVGDFTRLASADAAGNLTGHIVGPIYAQLLWLIVVALIGFGTLCYTGFGDVFRGLGISQIIGWGTTYYALGALSEDIARGTGWSQSLIFGVHGLIRTFF